MSASELRSGLHSLIDNIQDDKTLSIIYGLVFHSNINEKTATLTPVEKQAAEEALNSLDEGKFRKHEDVMTEMKKKFPGLH